MKRVISLALVICFVLLLLTPVVYALTLPDDLVALDLQDYFLKSYMKADYMVNEYLLYADSMVWNIWLWNRLNLISLLRLIKLQWMTTWKRFNLF